MPARTNTIIEESELMSNAKAFVTLLKAMNIVSASVGPDRITWYDKDDNRTVVVLNPEY